MPMLASQTYAGQSVISSTLASPVYYKVTDYISNATMEDFKINEKDLKHLTSLHRFDHVKQNI
jgi:hypothetical protein